MNRIVNLRPGDRIVVSKVGFPLIKHHAIYYSLDYYGRNIYVENAVNFGVRFILESDLLASRDYIEKVIPFPGNESQRKLALQKAKDLIGSRYFLIDFNCEHFANFIQFNQINSEQVDLAALLLLAVGVRYFCK